MSVTTVPIRPIARGSVAKMWIALAALCLAGAGLAWFATGGALQREVTESGLGFMVVTEGTGEPMTSADMIAMRLKVHVGGPDGQLIQDSDQSGAPYVGSTASVFPGFAEAMLRMRQNGHYQFWVPAAQLGSQLPPGAPFGPNDTLFFDVEVTQIERNMAALQQLLGPGGGGGPQAMEGAPPEGTARPPEAPPAGAEPAGNRQ